MVRGNVYFIILSILVNKINDNKNIGRNKPVNKIKGLSSSICHFRNKKNDCEFLNCLQNFYYYCISMLYTIFLICIWVSIKLTYINVQFYFLDCEIQEIPSISHVFPRIGSLNGGQQISIIGEGMVSWV